jgi:hypothetical protein
MSTAWNGERRGSNQQKGGNGRHDETKRSVHGHPPAPVAFFWGAPVGGFAIYNSYSFS